MEIKVTGEIKLTADTALLDVLDRLTRLQLANVGAGPITPTVEENAAQTASEPQNTKNKTNKKKKEQDNVKSKEAGEESAETSKESVQEADASAHGSEQTGDNRIPEPVSSADVSDATETGDISDADNSADNNSGDVGSESNSDSNSDSDKSDVLGTVTAEPEATEPQPERKPITMAVLRSNILPLVQTGKQPELKALLDKYNVKAVTALPREVWEDFADDMRKLGAKI